MEELVVQSYAEIVTYDDLMHPSEDVHVDTETPFLSEVTSHFENVLVL